MKDSKIVGMKRTVEEVQRDLIKTFVSNATGATGATDAPDATGATGQDMMDNLHIHLQDTVDNLNMVK